MLCFVIKLIITIFVNKLKNNVTENNDFRLGLIAQEVEQVLPGIVKMMPDSSKAIAYTDLTALLIEAIKEQQLSIDNLKHEIQLINEKYSLYSSSSKYTPENFDVISNVPFIMQNKPNPFIQTTEIKYFLPDNVKSANIYIHDLSGSQIKNIPIQNKGEGSIVINANELKPGIYNYTLIVNGKEVDTKKMILTN